MDALEIILLGCALFNIGLSFMLVVFLRLKVAGRALAEARAKLIYTWLCIPLAIICGVPLYLGIAKLFQVSLWHGTVLFASLVISVFLSLFLAVAGRIIIGWAFIKW